MEHPVEEIFRSLPLADKRVLRYAACFGGDFREDQLTELFALEVLRTREVLKTAVQSGILTLASRPQADKQIYLFSNEDLRESVYASMDPVERADAHFRIGNYLMRGKNAAALRKATLKIWGHLSQATDHLQTDREKQNYFEMSLQVASMHRDARDWEAVLRVMELVADHSAGEPDAWLLQYEALAMTGQSNPAEKCLAKARSAAKTTLDQARLNLVHARVLMDRESHTEAMLSCRKGLKILGLEFPVSGSDSSVRTTFNATHRMVQELSEKELRALPPMNVEEGKLLGELLQCAMRWLWVADRSLSWVLGLKFMQHHLKHGVHGHCHLGFSAYGMVMASQNGQLGTAAEMIRLGADIAEREGGRSPGIHLLRGLATIYSGPLAEGFVHFQKASDAFVEEGNPVASLEPLVALAAHQLHAGLPLRPLEKEIEARQKLARNYKVQSAYDALLVLRYNIRLLTGQPINALRDWADQPLDHRSLQQILKSKGPFPLDEWHVLLQMQHAFLMNHEDWATEYFDLSEERRLLAGGQFSFFETGFFGALAELTAPNPVRLKISINRIYPPSKWGKSLKKWAGVSPENFAARHELVESARTLAQASSAKLPAVTQKSIELADKSGSLLLSALSREVAGKALYKREATEKAMPLLEEARDLYRKWGAMPKVRRLESRYQLLMKSGHEAAGPVLEGATPLASAPDATALLNTTRIFFSQSSLHDLTSQIFQFFFSNFDSQCGSLILPSDSGFKVEFAAASDLSEAGRNSFAGKDFAHPRLAEILKSGKSGQIEGRHLLPLPETASPNVGNTVCFPLEREGKPWGLLCLEGTAALEGAGRDRAEMLAIYAGIALENVGRFEELRERVVHRTNDLEETLKFLSNARDQLMESEKLASLGQVTAGIAHEIRNPLNFVNNFSELSIELAGELREEIADLKGTVLDDKAVEIFEEYLEDLESNAEKIQTHGKRAESIVHNMLMHAASGKGESTKVDLNRLIREYALLAYHGIRGRLTNFVCQLAFDLDDQVGEMNIQQQDISRALLNIFQNGFQAMEEKTHTAPADYKPVIHIRSEVVDKAVRIAIRDNGPGIPEDVRTRIFEPFFTTKATGKGTGLGLSLAYELVVQGHGGELEVSSQPGEFTEFLITLPLET